MLKLKTFATNSLELLEERFNRWSEETDVTVTNIKTDVDRNGYVFYVLYEDADPASYEGEPDDEYVDHTPFETNTYEEY